MAEGRAYMSKSVFEITSEIVQAVVRARGQAIAGSGESRTSKERMIDEYLSNEAVVATYKEIFKAINDMMSS